MARTFRRHRQSHPIAELNVTNLIDLGFTLLIIFMITTAQSAQEQSIHINLPLESKSPQPKPDPSDHFVSVSVDARGYHIDNASASIGLSELREKLGAWSAAKKPPIVRVRGDSTVPYGKMIQLLDELKKANLTRISFDTQVEQ